MGTVHAAKVLAAGDGVLLRLHTLAGEAAHTIGGHDERGLEAQLRSVGRRGDADHNAVRGAQQVGRPGLCAQFGTSAHGPLKQLRVGLLALDDVAVRTVQGGGDPLAEKSASGVDREAREPAVIGLVEPVARVP